MYPSYVHFFWAGSYPPYDVIKNLTSWSKYLSTTEFIPILWVDRSAYNAILRPSIKCYRFPIKVIGYNKFKWKNCYDNIRTYSNAKELNNLNYGTYGGLPILWRDSINQFIKDSLGAKSFLWKDRANHTGVLRPINIIVVNIEDYITKEITHAQQTKKMYLAENFKAVLQYCELIHHYKLMTRFKNQFVLLMLIKFSGFYFDVDIKHTNEPFVTNIADIRECFWYGNDPVLFKMLIFEDNYSVEHPNNVCGSDVAFWFSPNQNNFQDKKCDQLNIALTKEVDPFYQKFRERIKNYKEDKQGSYSIINSFSEDLNTMPKIKERIRQMDYMRSFRDNRNAFAKELYLSKNESMMSCQERKELEELICVPLKKVCRHILTPSMKIVDHKDGDYIVAYETIFFHLFEQRYYYEPSSLFCTGYQAMEKKYQAVSDIENSYLQLQKRAKKRQEMKVKRKSQDSINFEFISHQSQIGNFYKDQVILCPKCNSPGKWFINDKACRCGTCRSEWSY